MKRSAIRFTAFISSLVLTLMFISTGAGVSVLAQNALAGEIKSGDGDFHRDENDYEAYSLLYASIPTAGDEMNLDVGDVADTDGEKVEKNGANGIYLQNGEYVRYAFSIPQAGRYVLEVEYASGLQKNSSYSVAVNINGEQPFQESGTVKMPKRWVNEKGPDQFDLDDFGNQLTPTQVEDENWQTYQLKNDEGYYNTPYLFYFEEGENTLDLTFTTGGLIVKGVNLIKEEKTIPYDVYLQSEWTPVSLDTSPIRIQGEHASSRSDATLVPLYDNSNPKTEPADPYKIVWNSIGQLKWTYPTQTLYWDFEVDTAGLYRMDIRARQNLKRGVTSARNIRIDGEYFYSEMETVEFPFSDKWYIESLGNDEGDCLVYLSAGPHTVSMEVAALYPELMRELQDVVFDLNVFYRNVIMITGTSPDTYTDYDIHKKYPNYYEVLDAMILKIRAVLDGMGEYGFQKGGEQEVVDRILTQLLSFRDDYESVPFRMKLYQDNISTMAAWIARLSEQPLEIDYIQFVSPEYPKEKGSAGFFNQITFNLKRFVSSFINDYTKLGNEDESEEAVNVWVSLGRDQVEVVKRLTDNYFVKQYGIPVNVNLVQQGLIPATLTGKGPDVALFVGPNDVVNLAARDALVDLSQYAGYEEITERFQKNSLVPYTYLDGVYGLPINESFLMMFYRKDIFEQLGIEPPDTWTEFYDVLSVIQRNNLTVGIPGSADTASATAGEMMFQNLLFQHGGDYYRDGWKTTAFDTPEALEAFTQWTDFYTKYSLPTAFDFYSRFRSGEMPLGIQMYTIYNMLYTAAPEIRGLWGMMPVPGYVREDGTVDRSVTGGGSGAIMFRNTRNKEGAFKFLDWWTSAETQSRYSQDIEALMGSAARFDTANVEAFESIPWSQEVSDVLMQQWNDLKLVQQTPVNYYISRNIINAYRKVVTKYANPRETLNKYNREINKEIARRRKEFNLD